MIIDRIDNVGKYTQIPDYVVKFIKNISNCTNTGKYILNDGEYVNIEEYTTKNLSDGKFETHNRYIDIQFLAEGNERIYLKSKITLNKTLGYSEDKDIEFYGDCIDDTDFVTLDGTNFVMIYPWEAHAPQISVGCASSKVKKVVVKLLF